MKQRIAKVRRKGKKNKEIDKRIQNKTKVLKQKKIKNKTNKKKPGNVLGRLPLRL